MKLIFNLLIFVLLFSFNEFRREPKFAPYVMNYNMNFAELHQKYGLKALTLCFIIAQSNKPEQDPCTFYWDGWEEVDNEKVLSNVRNFTQLGGEVIVSSAGALGTYVEHICPSVSKLVTAYKKVLSVTNSTHLDLNIEHEIQNDLVTQAIAQIQKETPAITLSITPPANDKGLTPLSINFLKTAVKNGVKVDIIDPMAMDFASNKTWAEAVADVGEATHKQLKEIWPNKTVPEIYSMIGLQPMIGRNDFGKTFTLEDGKKVVEYAKRKGYGFLAYWSLNRDNGNCPNQQGPTNNKCSGIAQQDFEFLKIFSDFEK